MNDGYGPRTDGGFTWGESPMSEKKDDGGPAFPQWLLPMQKMIVPEGTLIPIGEPGQVQFIDDKPTIALIGSGMSLRQWYAGLAMQGMAHLLFKAGERPDAASIAWNAIALADAMLEIEKEP